MARTGEVKSPGTGCDKKADELDAIAPSTIAMNETHAQED
jgi:hypothetical protein